VFIHTCKGTVIKAIQNRMIVRSIRRKKWEKK
jgi:hypothetical protein